MYRNPLCAWLMNKYYYCKGLDWNNMKWTEEMEVGLWSENM